MRFIILCISIASLSSCQQIKVKDINPCTVAGVMSAGADCDTTLSNAKTYLTMEQFIEFLEPAPGRGGAICLSTDDYVEEKSELEQACALLKNKCSEQLKAEITRITNRILQMSQKYQLPLAQ